MCRLFAMRAGAPVDPMPWLASFAARCRECSEFQGDGWGLSWWSGTGWERYRSVAPIWDDEWPDLPPATLLLAHARSAFRDDEVAVIHNMPFLKSGVAFAFNGELHGVRLSIPGANGAARLSNLYDRLHAASAGEGLKALARLDKMITDRAQYVRALNLVVSDGQDVWINTRFSENPDYFTLYRGLGQSPEANRLDLVSSVRLEAPPANIEWEPIPNGSTTTLPGG